jgi:choline dehydrogenase-like flavoprotein
MAHFDWIIIGSGFGGSVSALRLAEKGYSVLVLEKGKRWKKEDFPKSNWDVPRWMWQPSLGLKGIFQMSFFDHVTIMHGVGVGGGSLVYANTPAAAQGCVLRERVVGGARELEAGSVASLRDGRAPCSARRRIP